MGNKVFPEWLTKEQLSSRYSIMLVLCIIVPILSLVAIQYWFFTGAGRPHDTVVQGFLYAEGFAASCITIMVLTLFVYCVLRIVYFLQGYDLPDGDDLERIAGLDISNDYIVAMWTIRTSTFAVGYVLCTAVAYVFVYVVQLVLGSLWHWTPIAILLPLAIAAPVILAIHFRKRNRRLKIETQKIMNALDN